MPKPKPNPQDIKKPITFSLDADTLAILINHAMELHRGNLSAAARHIIQDWDNLRTPSRMPPPQ